MSTLVGYKDLPQEINEQINKVIHVWKEQVSDKLIGVYLHGAISLEAFHPESGDIDILVVVKDSLTVEEKLSIAKDIIEIDGKPRPIEISAIKEEDAKNWKTPGNCVFHYSDFWSAISADIDDYDFSDYNACTKNCPAQVEVQKIVRLSEKKKLTSDDAKSFHVEACIGCGACTYGCMAGKNVREVIRCAKEKL